MYSLSAVIVQIDNLIFEMNVLIQSVFMCSRNRLESKCTFIGVSTAHLQRAVCNNYFYY